MSDLSDINAQLQKHEEALAALRKQAEDIRNQEKQGVIAEVMAKIAEYGLAASDLGLATGSGVKRGPKAATSKSKEKAPVRYRSPSGETWSGGRGRKPGWVTKALADGKSLDQFAVQ
ncbi:H-NS histone family protein [Variovorax ginsengisoli]|uniref:DNA-binding protein H-NS n=1 Tax=Variovorax ginsengisoli TaxID=363844 RepID=A0ABT9SDF5_9BURK|nr:H-NS histone family protein [Variovorax ginsengisoli]MDP9902395.1 DNA-binding protein H-NS [Variovorax ginsengisoli]